MTDKPMSPERLDKAIERLNEFVAGARGPYTNIVSDMKTVLAEIDAMRERAEKAEREHTQAFQAGVHHQERAARMREALIKLSEHDHPRPLGRPYIDVNTPSKNDKCTHEKWMWDDCESCMAEYARSALEQHDERA